MTSFSKRFEWAAATVVVILWSSTVRAQTQAELNVAAKLARQALADHKAGRYEKSASKFLSAYEISRLPVQLRNAAKAFELAGQPSTALSTWQRYRAIASLDRDERKQADERIADLTAKLEPPPPPPIILAPPPAPPPPPEATVAVTTTTSNPWRGPVVAGAGAVITAVGIVFVATAASSQSNLERDTMIRGPDGRISGVRSYDDYVERQSGINRDYRIGGGLIAAGAVGLAVGIVLYLMD